MTKFWRMIVVRYLIITLLFTNCSCSEAQQLVHPVTPFANSGILGGQFVDAMDASANPALNPLVHEVGVGLHLEKRFMLPELSMLVMSGCIPVNGDGLSMVSKFFGDGKYRERTFALAYGKSLGIVNAGMSIGYFDLHVDRSKKFSSLQTVIASIINVSKVVCLGLSITNPRFFISNQKDVRLASSYSFGLGWQPSTITFTSIEIIKEENSRAKINLLLQYIFAQHFTFSLSWSVTSNQPCISMSWLVNKVRIKAGAAYHPSVGVSPFATFLLQKKTWNQVNE